MPADRVNDEELDFDDDQRLYNGLPFTGISYVEYPGGTVKQEAMYKDGFKDGLCREWFANGQLRCEWFAVHGRARGRVTCWHMNGKLKSVGEYEHGVELQYDEWTESGKAIVSRRVNTDSELFKYLRQVRISAPQYESE